MVKPESDEEAGTFDEQESVVVENRTLEEENEILKRMIVRGVEVLLFPDDAENILVEVIDKLSKDLRISQMIPHILGRDLHERLNITLQQRRV